MVHPPTCGEVEAMRCPIRYCNLAASLLFVHFADLSFWCSCLTLVSKRILSLFSLNKSHPSEGDCSWTIIFAMAGGMKNPRRSSKVARRSCGDREGIRFPIGTRWARARRQGLLLPLFIPWRWGKMPGMVGFWPICLGIRHTVVHAWFKAWSGGQWGVCGWWLRSQHANHEGGTLLVNGGSFLCYEFVLLVADFIYHPCLMFWSWMWAKFLALSWCFINASINWVADIVLQSTV